jgi:hypothetical protein
MRSHIRQFNSDGYLSSRHAINALQGAVKENIRISKLSMLTLSYDKSMTLDKFTRTFHELLLNSVRTVKQEWPQKAGLIVRNIFESDTSNKFNVQMRNGHEYETTKSNIKSFLNRAVYMMSTVLTGYVRVSLDKYVHFVEQLSLYSVNVQSIKSVSVNLSPESLYCTKG